MEGGCTRAWSTSRQTAGPPSVRTCANFGTVALRIALAPPSWKDGTSLRHAYGKHCVDRSVDIRIIAEALGHESLESTKIYTQVSFERTRRIAELFALPGV